MKLVYVTASLPYGPGEAFLIPEIEELRNQGHHLLLIPLLPRGPLLHRDGEQLLPITVTENLFSAGILTAAALEFVQHPRRTIGAIASLLGSRTFKIAAKNLSVVPKSLWLARLASRFGADHIHAQWGSCPATMALIASKQSGIPFSFTVHSWEIAEDNLLTFKVKSAAFVRAVSEFGRSRMQPHTHPSVPLEVLHLGIRLPVVAGFEARGEGQFRIVIVASLHRIKGHRYLFEACSIQLNRGMDVIIDVLGDGPERQELEHFAAVLGAARRICFKGNIPHDRVLSMISSGHWDAMVLPSIVANNGEQEGIPVSLMEAMARCLPVISTTTGGIPELVGDSAGILVPPGDPTSLAGAVQILASDPELRRELGTEGRKRVEQAFVVDSIVRELVCMIERSLVPKH